MRFNGVPTWCATLAACQRLPQREHPLIAVHQFLIPHAQLRGGFIDAFLQGHVEVLEASQHLVEAAGDLADLVGTDNRGARAEVASAGAPHRIVNVTHGPVDESPREPVDDERQQYDDSGREP
jgi:hypothetical protein